MRLATFELFCDDSPWLNHKINKTKIPLVHAQISNQVALSLGQRL
jgi:hypothetical protein